MGWQLSKSASWQVGRYTPGFRTVGVLSFSRWSIEQLLMVVACLSRRGELQVRGKSASANLGS